jgi:predicted NBD/HSP70 family sugar kinase
MHKKSTDHTFGPLARGVAQSGVRIANERAVMTLIGLSPGVSNADLARLSGLGPQTTSRIVADLEARGLVRRGEVLRGKRGQPATPLFLDPDGAYSIGVDVSWRHVEIMLFSMAGAPIASIRRDYDWPDPDLVLELVQVEIVGIRARLKPLQAERLCGIGVATPGWFEHNLYRLGAPPEIARRWAGFDFAGRLEAFAGLPVDRCNDGNAGCWSELISHPEPRPSAMAYIQIGTFVSSGIVITGDLWKGPRGEGAELGAFMIDDGSGAPTYVHLVASLFALEEELKVHRISAPAGGAISWNWALLEPAATEWLDRAGLAIAKTVVSIMGMIELETVIVDGALPRPVSERLIARVQDHLAVLPRYSGEPPQIALGINGHSAAASGAAQLVLYNRFFSRAWELFAH